MPLTPEQRAVINHPGGHAKVMAVAGAGKTTTLVYFVRQCLANGIPPRRLLVLMYNKAAQQDFQKKLNLLLKQEDSRALIPEIRTFHSLGLRIYKQLISMGHLPSFREKLLTDGEIESVVWKLLQQCADPETAKDILDQKSKWVEPATNFIDLVKSTLNPPELVFESSGLPAVCRFFPKVFRKFELWRKEQRRISFSDMLYDPCMFFKSHPEIASHFSGHMQQILVDEYQDINEIQQFLLTTLRGDQGDLMVVGDPDQTIYEFRGSRPEFMTTEFDHSFEGVHLYNLSHTFRYGHRLSLLCNYLIANNPDRKGVLCLSNEGNEHTKLNLIEYQDYSQSVLSIIKEQSEKLPLSSIAILNRIWAISAPIELALLENSIPYQMDHSISVLDRSELAPFEALLSIAAGNYSSMNTEQRIELLIVLLTQPFPKIRRKVLLQIANMAAQFGDQPGKAIRQVMPDTLSNRQADQLLTRSRLLDQALTDRFTSDQLLQKYYSSTEMEEGIRDSAFSAQQVDDRLETVKAFLRYYRSLKLPAKEGWSHWQTLREKRQSNQTGGVRLTSMHRSKGLEWPCVIIPGLSQRFMPYRPEGELTIPSSIESERRLMYVAMTRAKQHLYLLSPNTRLKDKTKDSELISPFLDEMTFDVSDSLGAAIDKSKSCNITVPSDKQEIASDYLSKVNSLIQLDIVETETIETDAAFLKRSATSNFSKTANLPSKVRHQVYGVGKVVTEENRYWIIRFESGVEKQFDKRVASQYIEFL